MKLPKMWRKRRGGKFVGSWRATVAGVEVNLGSSDAEKARQELRRRLEARGAELENLDDVADLENAAPPADGLSPSPTSAAPPPPPPTPPALPPIPAAPPPPEPGDADDMAAAAADVGGSANDNGAADPPFDPQVLDAFLRQGATLIVDAQLGLQAAIIRRRLKRVPGPVAADSPLRAAAAEAWVAQLKIWFPADVMLPPWAMALILPALAIPVQIAGSAPITDAEVAA